MAIKVGNIICHSGALEWGAGKVLDITASAAMIQFSDGKSRKIAVSHHASLQPAAADSFVPAPETVVENAAPRVRAARKKK